MHFETYDCDRCGGDLKMIDSETYKCEYCGKVFIKREAEDKTKEFRDMFDEMKREHINNLRRNLYDAVNAEYISSFEVKARAEGILALDFEGERFDMGAKIGFLKANVVQGAKHPETGEEFKAFLKAFVKTLD